jgi:hypothetical protein
MLTPLSLILMPILLMMMLSPFRCHFMMRLLIFTPRHATLIFATLTPFLRFQPHYAIAAIGFHAHERFSRHDFATLSLRCCRC